MYIIYIYIIYIINDHDHGYGIIENIPIMKKVISFMITDQRWQIFNALHRAISKRCHNFCITTLVSSFPVNVFKTECSNCYKKGSVDDDKNGCPDETNVCECKTGYVGIKFDKCDEYTLNHGTASRPKCDRKLIRPIATVELQLSS